MAGYSFHFLAIVPSVHTRMFSFPFLTPSHFSISKDVWTQKSNGFFFFPLPLSLPHAVFPLCPVHHLSHKLFSLIQLLTTPTQCHLPAGRWLPQLVIITVRGGPIPSLYSGNHYFQCFALYSGDKRRSRPRR